MKNVKEQWDGNSPIWDAGEHSEQLTISRHRTAEDIENLTKQFIQDYTWYRVKEKKQKDYYFKGWIIKNWQRN